MGGVVAVPDVVVPDVVVPDVVVPDVVVPDVVVLVAGRSVCARVPMPWT